MPYQPLQSSSSLPQNYNQMNKALAQLNQEAVVKTWNTTDGQVVAGKLPNGDYGFGVVDNGVLMVRITKDGIFINDGTNDRILMGKDVGGFA